MPTVSIVVGIVALLCIIAGLVINSEDQYLVSLATNRVLIGASDNLLHRI
jgi:hypothetical protein